MLAQPPGDRDSFAPDMDRAAEPPDPCQDGDAWQPLHGLKPITERHRGNQHID
jgi:hypothetical protein